MPCSIEVSEVRGAREKLGTACTMWCHLDDAMSGQLRNGVSQSLLVTSMTRETVARGRVWGLEHEYILDTWVFGDRAFAVKKNILREIRADRTIPTHSWV